MTNGLSNRWVRGNLMVTTLLLVTVETLLMLYTVNNSYAVARQSLQGEISLLSNRYESVEKSSEHDRAALLRTLLQETAQDDTATYSMQLLNGRGELYASSEGLLPGQLEAAGQTAAQLAQPQTPLTFVDTAENAGQTEIPDDFLQAEASDTGTGESVSRTSMGEQVLAITWLIPSPVHEVSAVRLVTSLNGINNRIFQVLVVSLTAVAACFLLILLTGVYFIRSIVRPLAQVESTATKIAQGNFDIRLQKKHNDEIGRLCETINNMAEELSKTDKLKNEFISSVSHELRTPLTSIKGWTETLQRIDDVHDENYIHGMRIISSETDRLYAMVEELLDFSRMQNKGLELHCSRLDLAAEVGDAVLMVQQRALQAGITLHYDEPDAVLAVSGDTNRLRQVLINILDNAVKYSPEGGTITVSLAGDEGFCSVSVADQGPGIAPDELELVKTKFYKGRGAVRGSGIGLAVADEIVQAHGGQLKLSSLPGMGTTVTISLPRLAVG